MKLVFLLLFFSLTAEANCDIEKKCEAFEEVSYACRIEKKELACKRFVGLFRGLLGRGECKRSFDKDPVYDVWYCASLKGAADLDLHYEALKKLQFRTAKNLSASKAFKRTLDGHLAE